MSAQPSTRDLFAEFYVAGLFADAGWQLYFPKRDHGFDFIATKLVRDSIVIRPVQVKGLYPTAIKKDKATYGYKGQLSQVHDDMVLAMPFFPTTRGPAPVFTAFLPIRQIRPHKSKLNEYSAQPALFRDGKPIMRRDFRRFFDDLGLQLMERRDFANACPEKQ
jgi:hypothetical protein